MTRIGNLTIAVLAVIMTVSLQEALALKCWKCSSDSADGAFCNDPFDETALSPRQKRWSFVTCPNKSPRSDAENRRPACKKTIQLVSGKEVIGRTCYWESANSTQNGCTNDYTPSYIETVSCETCTTDGCNGAAQNGPSNDDHI